MYAQRAAIGILSMELKAALSRFPAILAMMWRAERSSIKKQAGLK